MRRQHPKWGAKRVRLELLRRPPEGMALPSERTINRIFARQGPVVPRPRKRPRSSYRRWQRPGPMQLWQIDIVGGVMIADTRTGELREAKVVTGVDDHSRCVFATFTAPSFGPVHARRSKTVLPCRPRRDHKERRCPHGRDISCPRRHNEDDPRLGRPLCPDCYDYTAAVLFNLHAADLWRRFTTYLPRKLAALAGLTQRQVRALARVRVCQGG